MYNAPLGTRGLNTTDPARYSSKVAYAYAKRAQAALTDYWNEKYGGRGITFYVTHPGWSKTPGVKTAMPLFWKIQNVLLRTPMQGADTALWLCSERPAEPKSACVWFDRKPRPIHIFDYTKNAQCTKEELASFMRADLDGQLPAR
jgi:NAD(P)-dependent dehydrogenase (short-subunit alcohol dehydrogenase family)